MIKTAESVSPMHPDKICDQISDAILDECLRQDPLSRVAVEVMGSHGIITISGELTTNAFVDFKKIAKRIAGDKYGITVNIETQSPEIAQGVDVGGAGDQGIMIGYACNENPALIPNEVFYSRSLCQFVFERFPFDGKTQVTINEHGKITTVVVSFQNVSKDVLEGAVENWVFHDKVPVEEGYKILANPAGDWNIGGFDADTGLTGRKLAVDNYGTQIPIGGGAFSGKDSTKVDRSGAYMARKIAVDLLKLHDSTEVLVKIAYAIGVAEPVMAVAEVIDPKTSRAFAINLLEENPPEVSPKYDLTPNGIIKFLDLRTPQFEETARFGHFGNNFKWDN